VHCLRVDRLLPAGCIAGAALLLRCALPFFFCTLGAIAIGGSSYIKLEYTTGYAVVPSCGGVVVVMALLKVGKVVKATALVHRSWSLGASGIKAPMCANNMLLVHWLWRAHSFTNHADSREK
jgi:hypothetical protein